MIKLNKQKLHHLDIKPCNILFNYVNKGNRDIIGEYNNDIDEIFETGA